MSSNLKEIKPKLGQAHLQFTQTNANTKNCKRAYPADTKEEKQRNGNNVYKSLGGKCRF